MHWIAPSEKDTASTALEKRLWDAAGASSRRGNRIEEPTAYHAQGILYL